ncbi:Predicted arabinose efflux permease, MFS family [Marivirga sericea]|uniref:Predicted arabinose efflux permease, MFS family n=1 Tax=Marivirga sericea TaxID=1028 RepID=A0A1X7I7Q9_9BACT|nr:MFS transporter [Marivirga sericea]SMG09911.1 Predicted arabinose efflux permease, MFS family [Marivirga sericea]
MVKRQRKDIFGTDRRVVILGFARMADAMGNSFLIVVLPLYIASESIKGEFLGLTESLITGLILGLFGLITSFSQPFTGRLSDKIGKRKLFVVLGLAIFTLANFSYSLAHTYYLLMVIRIAQGIAAAFTITASLALVSELSQKKTRGNNMGVYNSFRLIGFGLGPLASGVLVESGPYNLPLIGPINGFVASFLVASGAALLSALLVAFFVSDPEETEPSNRKMKIRITSAEKGRILDPIFALALATLVMSFGFSLLAPIETKTNERLSQGAFMFSLEFSALIGALAIAQPIIGKASDKFGRRIFIIIGLVGLIPIVFLEGLVTQPWQLITARAFQGISAAMVFAPSLALAGDLAEKGNTGTQLSVVTMAFGLGISLGSFVSGYSIRFGYLTPFLIGAIMAGIGVLIVTTQVPKNVDKVE